MNNSRIEYLFEKLDEQNLPLEPFGLFEQWFQEASSSGIIEPNAAALATCSPEGKPSVRIVLIKEINQQGFVFFTNYNSRKGSELKNNPYAAITFFWDKLQRQVRIEGKTEKISEEKSVEYFNSRPVGSRLSAWVSQQSQEVADRKTLEETFATIKNNYPGEEIPKPPHWGGYILIPEKIEFWQGRENRMHDRILFSTVDQNQWQRKRLFP